MANALDESIEFQEVANHSHTEPVSRTHYRVQVRGRENFFLDFQSTCYPLLDVSQSGVCVAISARSSLALDSLISNCSLVAGHEVFEGLEGRIVHYSLGSSGDWICGIQWLNLTTHTTARMKNLVNSLRKELFSHD